MFPVGLQSFSNIFTNTYFIVHILISVANGFLLFFSSMKLLLALQQSSYKPKRFFKWLTSSETVYLSRLMLLCLLGFLFFCVLSTCFSSIINKELASFIGFGSYILFTSMYINTEKSVNAKVPLKKTRRLVGLCITYIILLSAFTFLLMLLFDFLAYKINGNIFGILRYSLICGMPILMPYILFLALYVNEPVEFFIRRRYIKIAKNKLDKANIIKIGITGSYGKTSVKEILTTILSQKYRVLQTPKSYNTPLGICLAVRHLDSTHDIFIAEMGARNRGDISELCSIVKPTIGVLTGVNNQHLESFNKIENIVEAKYELFLGLEKGGKGFFSCDNDKAKELYNRFNGEKYLAGVSDKNSFVYASDIKISSLGTDFILNILGEEPIKCTTTLLGEHSVKNICLASAVAYSVGLTKEQIKEGILRIKSVEHRLELVPNNKGIIIIDDSYNSNVDGVNSAMQVLKTFNGRKIVLTPGLVELGKEEALVNLNFGKLLAKNADIVIIIGKHNAEMLIQGLIEGGMKRENILFYKTLNKGNEKLNEILKSGDVVLFENDLPDNYS